MNSKNIKLQVLQLAWPVVIEMILQMMVGIVDVAMVGRLGATALAGIGLGHQVSFFSLSLFSALTTGATAIVARQIGANNVDDASKTARETYTLAIIISILVAILLWILAPQAIALMTILNPKKDLQVINLAVEYLRIVALTLPLGYLMTVINGILRGAGDTRTPMKLVAFVNIINIIGDYVLIFGIKPFFPGVGARGSAIATASAWLIGGLLINYIIFRGNTDLDFSIKKNFFPTRDTICKLSKISIPAAGEQVVMRGGQMVFGAIVAGLSTVSFAAHQVAISAESISFMPGFAFAVAATTLVGQELGSKQPSQAEACGWESRNLALIFMSIMGVIFFFFAPNILNLYTHDAHVISLGSKCLKLIAIGQPFLAHVMVLAGALRGAGDTKWTMIITFLGMWPVRLTSAYILAYTFELELIGAWIAMNIDLAFRATLFWLRFNSGSWKKIKL